VFLSCLQEKFNNLCETGLPSRQAADSVEIGGVRSLSFAKVEPTPLSITGERARLRVLAEDVDKALLEGYKNTLMDKNHLPSFSIMLGQLLQQLNGHGATTSPCRFFTFLIGFIDFSFLLKPKLLIHG
jgi:hypothetical protein